MFFFQCARLSTKYGDISYDMKYLLTEIGWHPVAVVQYTFTHKQYTEQHNETEYTERNVPNSKNT